MNLNRRESERHKPPWGDWAMIAAFLIGMFWSQWFPNRFEPKLFLALALLTLGVHAWIYRKKNRQNLESLYPVRKPSRSAIHLMLVTGLAGIGLFLICTWTDAFHGDLLASLLDKSFVEWLLVKIPTIVVQQVILQLLIVPVLVRRLRRVSLVIAFGAIVFSLLHFPNPLLVGLTLLAGSVWIFSYLRSQQLLPIMISHAVLAIFAAGFCGEYILNMRVGIDCVSLLPKKLETDVGPKYEFPNCVVGCAERLSQSGDELLIEGWVYDSIHHRCPTALYVNVSGRLIEVQNAHFELADSSRWANAREAGFVDSTCYSFTATVPIAITEAHQSDVGLLPGEFRLYAANINGRVAEIGRMGALQATPMRLEPTIVLFPVELDGRIDHIRVRNDQWQLRGWAIDLKAEKLARQLCIESEGKLTYIDLSEHRLTRPTTANAFDQPTLQQCGFEIVVGPTESLALNGMKCYAVDGESQLHALRLTPGAEAWVAERTRNEPGIHR